VNLVIDSDTAKEVSLRVPGGSPTDHGWKRSPSIGRGFAFRSKSGRSSTAKCLPSSAAAWPSESPRWYATR